MYTQLNLSAIMLVGLCPFIHSFIQVSSIAPLQVRYYSEAPPTQHGYYAGVSRRSATGNCELRTCPNPYVAARVGVEPTTLRLKAIDSTNAPPRPVEICFLIQKKLQEGVRKRKSASVDKI